MGKGADEKVEDGTGYEEKKRQRRRAKKREEEREIERDDEGDERHACLLSATLSLSMVF